MGMMRLSIRFWEILLISLRSAVSQSQTVNEGIGIAAICHSSVTQTCSIGFKLVERAVFSLQYIVSVLSMLFPSLTVCGPALSCIKRKESPAAAA